jgi:nucleotide-binding universal stress UspA family protein
MTTTTPAPGRHAGGDVVAVDHHAVLVPLDGSELSERALEPARWLAARLGATVHTLIVGYVDDARWYSQYVRSLRQRYPQVFPHYVGEPGTARGVARVARTLDHPIVCMATHGRSRTAAVLGSTFTAVARSNPGPIVAVGPGATVPRQDARRVVACLDGTPTSEQILPLATAWARHLGATLDLVAVIEPAPPLPNHRERHRTGPLVDPAAYLEQLARRPELADPGIEIETHVAFDALGPDEGLVDHLRRHPATLVVTTSHLRTHVDRAIHGSAAARIVRSCPVPVLVQPVEGAM